MTSPEICIQGASLPGIRSLRSVGVDGTCTINTEILNIDITSPRGLGLVCICIELDGTCTIGEEMLEVKMLFLRDTVVFRGHQPTLTMLT